MKILSTAWMLIAVSAQGNVNHTEYQSEHLCEEAKSIFLVGKTIEEVKAQRDAWEKAEKERTAKWAKDHPPREPKNDSERAMVSGTGPKMSAFPADKCGADYCGGVHVNGNKIQDDPVSMWTSTTVVTPAYAYPEGRAVCIHEGQDSEGNL